MGTNIVVFIAVGLIFDTVTEDAIVTGIYFAPACSVDTYIIYCTKQPVVAGNLVEIAPTSLRGDGIAFLAFIVGVDCIVFMAYAIYHASSANRVAEVCFFIANLVVLTWLFSTDTLILLLIAGFEAVAPVSIRAFFGLAVASTLNTDIIVCTEKSVITGSSISVAPSNSRFCDNAFLTEVIGI